MIKPSKHIRLQNVNNQVQNISSESEKEIQSQSTDNFLELSETNDNQQANKKKTIPHAIRHILKKKR